MTKKATPRLNALLDSVQQVFDGGVGTPSELAKFLVVTRFHIYKWITKRDHEPGGEATLAMQEWVTAKRGHKTKSPGRALTQPERKTRSRRISHEKPKPSPP